jgi:tricarballylate dehydrogenase
VDSGENLDVLVVGGGNAGLCAALAARQAGARRVLIVEHAPAVFRGGNSRHTRNLRAMHDQPTETLVESYGEEEFWQDLLRVTKGRTDAHLARIAIRGTVEAVPWLAGLGAAFQPSLTGTLSLSRTNLFFHGGGKAHLNRLYAAAEQAGIEVLYDSEVTELRLDGGAVQEARMSRRGFPATIKAKAYVAASGGFQANFNWLRRNWGDRADNFLVRGTGYAQGTILRNLLDQGVASAGDPAGCHAVAIDARAPKVDGGIVTRLDCVPFSIVVNRDCQRFYDEGEDFWPKRYAIWGKLVAEQPGQIAWSIFDAKVPGLYMPSVFPAIEAPTIEALADRLGLDRTALAATVAAYNRAVVPGRFDPAAQDDCRTEGLTPPKTHWARAIDTGPFYAYPLRPGITFTYLGVKTDARAQLFLENGRPIANLFASGEIMAGNILGEGYLAGFGMSIGTVYGRIAGEGAAQHALG